MGQYISALHCCAISTQSARTIVGKAEEYPNGTPNNLLPYISQVAIEKLKMLSVYGNDYPTHDGAGVRDYIQSSIWRTGTSSVLM